jgi:hypothetical protein
MELAECLHHDVAAAALTPAAPACDQRLRAAETRRRTNHD